MNKIPVIAIFDVGKTNKKIFLFDEKYNIVYEKSARFTETVDEDGDPCENLESLRLSIFDSLNEIFRRGEFDIKAINFSSYGASLVYLDQFGNPVTPLYNYLKEYPNYLMDELHDKYGGAERFSLDTASPVLGSLNSGLQILRIQKEKPELYQTVHHILHLPQYLSSILTGKYCSDKTSIGCHTSLWDYKKSNYHQWVSNSKIDEKLAPIVSSEIVFPSTFPGNSYVVGTGLHDSSAALIPYLLNLNEPFVLISTGTWSISFNPFNHEALTLNELRQDCLFYLSYKGKPVKASRLFLGFEHDRQAKRIAEHFNCSTSKFKSMGINWWIIDSLRTEDNKEKLSLESFDHRDLNNYSSAEIAYHRLMLDLIAAQFDSTSLIINKRESIHRIFVDGGFSNNEIYMSLLSEIFYDQEVYAASMAQASALGAALAIHQHWSSEPLPNHLIELKYYSNINN